MAKNFTHLKPVVFQAFDQGKSALEVIKFFKIPKSTAYDWLKEFKESKVPKPSIPKNPETLKPAPLEIPDVSEPPRPFTVIDGGLSELSDFQLVRRTLRSLISDPDVSSAVRLKAALGLMRLVPLKAKLPKHVLEDSEVSSLKAERRKLEGLTAEELARLYKEELEASS